MNSSDGQTNYDMKTKLISTIIDSSDSCFIVQQLDGRITTKSSNYSQIDLSLEWNLSISISSLLNHPLLIMWQNCKINT